MKLVANAKNAVKSARDWWHGPLLDAQHAQLAVSQLALVQRYQELAAAGGPYPSWSDVGFRVYSDTDEDGLLLYLFAMLGTTNRYVIDIGSTSYTTSNSANLVLHHGWSGLLVDGDAACIADAQRFFAANPSTRVYPPKSVTAFVTAENINELVTSHGAPATVDLLTIDIDGMDIWVWRALTAVRPRVVVIEFQDILGPERSVAVPYSPDFDKTNYPENAEINNYVGASLAAMVKVGREKGYRLVGANRMGFNAFFVADGLGEAALPERTPAECLVHPWNAYGEATRYPLVSNMEWVTV